MNTVTLRELFDALQERMQLRLLAGKKGLQKEIVPPNHQIDEHIIAGSMNFIHPPLIPLIGKIEKSYILGLSAEEQQRTLQQLFAQRPIAILLTSGQTACNPLKKAAMEHQVPLFTTPLNDYQALDNLFYCTSRFFSQTISMHGVFLDVLGVGVLLTGDSAIGKSELALELITRGHSLIADDVVKICRIAPDILSGSCPSLLKEFLEVRGLGILNMRAMFGEGAVKHHKYVQLIIHLKRMRSQEISKMERLSNTDEQERILGVNIPKVTIPVAPGRNLAILVETAVRRHLLRLRGYDATQIFIEKQAQAIAKK